MNTKALSLAGLLTSGINHPGIPLDDDGLPTGELKGPEVMMSVAGYVGFDRSIADADAQGLQGFRETLRARRCDNSDRSGIAAER